MKRIVELASLERAYNDINYLDSDSIVAVKTNSEKVGLLVITSGRIAHTFNSKPNKIMARVT